MQIYQDKLQERRLDVLKNILGSSESANEMMINRFSMLLSFYEYIERNYLPYVKESRPYFNLHLQHVCFPVLFHTKKGQ